MYFDYIVRKGGARFNDLRTGVFFLKRLVQATSCVKTEGLYAPVEPKEAYKPKSEYILSDGKNTLHLEFNDRGRVVGATSYSSNQVKHMIASIGSDVICPAGAP